MTYHRQRARLTVAIALSVVALLAVAQRSKATGTITKADLSGPWAMTLIGNTGCGMSTMYVTFTLSTAGSGSATITSHSSGCGDSTSTAEPFTINTLSVNGSGTANLSCGAGCGWNLDIQVSSDRSIFNVVDVSPVNPGNFLQGVAIHQ